MNSEKRIAYVEDEETKKPIRIFIGYTNEEYRDYIYAEAKVEAMRQSLLRQSPKTKKNNEAGNLKQQRSKESA
jgi:hypothetical protein